MKKGCSGFSLIEVLISLLILSLILLGFDAMEISALRLNREAYLFSVAENQLNSMIERLRAGAINEIEIWNQQNKELLPEGRGSVSGQYPEFLITLFWGEKTEKKNCEESQIGKLKCLKMHVQI